MNTNKILSLVIVCLVLVEGACSHRKPIRSDIVNENGKLGVSVIWLKDKGSKYDLQLQLKNNSTDPLIVMLADIACYKNNVAGELRHTFFNTGERTIDFKGGQVKRFNMVCNVGLKTPGKDYKIVVSAVHANPSGDGKTATKKIDGPIEWTDTL